MLPHPLQALHVAPVATGIGASMSWAGNVWGNEAWGQSDNGGSWTNREASPSSTYAIFAWLRADWSAGTEGPAGGNSQASPGGDQKESKKQISFYTTLGMKHPFRPTSGGKC